MSEVAVLGPSNDDIPADEMALAAERAAIAHKNQRFMKASPARKRVLIAKDVLKWLKARKITPVPDRFVDVLPGVDTPSDNDETLDGGTCRCCALGAMALCDLERRSEASARMPSSMSTLRGVTSTVRQSIRDKSFLGGYVDDQQLLDIEAAFEGTTTFGGSSEAAYAFADRPGGYPSPDERMRLIMKNIVQHKGTFVPSALREDA